MDITKEFGYEDPPAKSIGIEEWHELFKKIPDEILKEYRYFRNDGYFPYIFPPTLMPIYGARNMRNVKFDNSLASLRLWSFVMSTRARCFRAKHLGKKVFTSILAGDALAPIIMSSKKATFFNAADNVSMPFRSGSKEAFRIAERYGLNENFCVARAALSPLIKRAYAPDPEVCFVGVGATCDDVSAVTQLLDWLGYECMWFELPVRKDRQDWYKRVKFRKTYDGRAEYQEHALEFLTEQFRLVKEKVEEITGESITDENLRKTIKKMNHVRESAMKIRDLVSNAEKCPLPATEMLMIASVSATFSCDLDESLRVLEHVYETIAARVERDEGPLSGEKYRVVSNFPTFDMRICNLLEALGMRLIYEMPHLMLCKTREDGDPLEAIADSFLNTYTVGSSAYRVEKIKEIIRNYNADGLIISGFFGSSHCPVESRMLSQEVKEALNLPVLSVECSFPGDEPWGQTRTRYEAFVEVLKSRRKTQC